MKDCTNERCTRSWGQERMSWGSLWMMTISSNTMLPTSFWGKTQPRPTVTLLLQQSHIWNHHHHHPMSYQHLRICLLSPQMMHPTQTHARYLLPRHMHIRWLRMQQHWTRTMGRVRKGKQGKRGGYKSWNKEQGRLKQHRVSTPHLLLPLLSMMRSTTTRLAHMRQYTKTVHTDEPANLLTMNFHILLHLI